MRPRNFARRFLSFARKRLDARVCCDTLKRPPLCADDLRVEGGLFAVETGQGSLPGVVFRRYTLTLVVGRGATPTVCHVGASGRKGLPSYGTAVFI